MTDLTPVLKPGTVIEITDEGEVKLLDKASNAIHIAESVFTLAFTHHKNAHEEFWKTMHALHPELENFQALYEHATHKVIIRHKLSDEEGGNDES